MATNKTRAASVKARWREAKLYAKRHGTVPRLDRRSVTVKLTNADITKQVRGLFKAPKRRLAGGKRGTESGRLRADAFFRLTILDRQGVTRGQSGTLKFQRLADRREETAALIHAVRRANNGVFNLFTDYAELKGEVHVTEGGSFEVSGERWRIVLEPDVEGEPLLPQFASEEP